MSAFVQLSPRPASVPSVTDVVRTMHGKLYVTITFDEDQRPFEVFAILGKADSCNCANLQALSRIASVLLRAGVAPIEITKHLRHISCCPIWTNGVQVESLPDAIGQVLNRYSEVNDADKPLGAHHSDGETVERDA